MNFQNVSFAGGEMQIHFCVATKSFWNSKDDKDQDTLYLKCWFQTNEGKGLSYRDKSVKISGNAIYGLKISLATGKISKVEPTEFWNSESGIINKFDRDMTYGIYTNNNDASDACKKQLDPILRQWVESYDISSLLKECRKEHIESNLASKEKERQDLLKQIALLDNSIETLEKYNTIA